MDFGIWTILLIMVKTTLYVSGFLAMGSALFWLIFSNQIRHIRPNLFKVILWASFLNVISAAAFILVQTGYIVEDGFMGMFDAEMLQIFLEDNIGTSFYLRIIGAAILVACMSFRLNWLLPLPITFIAASFAMVGHATGDNALYTRLLLIVHLLAVGFWLGALWPLYICAENENAGKLLERFGKLASYIVPILILVGGLFALTIVPSFGALFSSSYGLSLVFKIAIVAVLLSLAALNKIKLAPDIATQETGAIKKLRMVIRLEALAFMLIFITTAALTSVMTLPE